jgi:hypothetical protein
LVNTVFAKAPEITLFRWGAVTQPARPGSRTNWQDLRTSFDYNRLLDSVRTNQPNANLTWGRVAGDALQKAHAILGRLVSQLRTRFLETISNRPLRIRFDSMPRLTWPDALNPAMEPGNFLTPTSHQSANACQPN